MNKADGRLAKLLLSHAQHSLRRHHLPRIVQCLALLSHDEIWWRPHPSSNSVGNLVLHLNGNVRQWIISGLGGAPDRRDRNSEFSETGPIPKRKVFGMLRATVDEACRVIRRLTLRNLVAIRTIQGFRVSGLTALLHVTEHFANHTGQIILVTKMKRRRDLRFTRLPGKKAGRQSRRTLSTI